MRRRVVVPDSDETRPVQTRGRVIGPPLWSRLRELQVSAGNRSTTHVLQRWRDDEIADSGGFYAKDDKGERDTGWGKDASIGTPGKGGWVLKGERPTQEVETKLRPLVMRGSAGEYVRFLQQRLNAMGAKPPLKVDGFFGAATEKAVRALQAEVGAKVDGKVGHETWAILDPD